MDSNFTPLKKNHSDLYSIASKAEHLMLSQTNTELIPTLLRILTEGLLIKIQGEVSPELNSAIRYFREHNPSAYSLINDLHLLRKKGNESAHYMPPALTVDELIYLFKAANSVQNYLICKIDGQHDLRNEFSAKKLWPTINKSKLDELSESKTKLSKAIKNENSLRLQLTEYEASQRRLLQRIKLQEEQHKELDDEKNDLLSKLHSVEQAKETDDQQKTIDQLKQKIDQLTAAQVVTKKLSDKDHRAFESLGETWDKLLTEIDKTNNSDISTSFNDQNIFSSEQEKLIEIESGKHLLQAPPGSGKTRVLTLRLAKALQKYQDDQDIVCLTFTNRAAFEMTKRASKYIGSRQPFIGNLHTFCSHIIRNDEYLAPSIRYATVLNDEYRDELYAQAKTDAISEILTGQSNIPHQISKRLNDVLKNQLDSYTSDLDERSDSKAVTPEKRPFLNIYTLLLSYQLELDGLYLSDKYKTLNTNDFHLLFNGITALLKSEEIETTPTNIQHFAALLTAKFLQLKRQIQSIDYDDILIYGLKCLQIKPIFPRFIQIDEAQDLNPLQWDIVNTISNDSTHVFAAGDQDQAIYGFLGASNEHLQKNTQGFNAQNLTHNFRSNPDIVELLNHYRKSHWGLNPIKAHEQVNKEKNTLLLGYETDHSEQESIKHAVETILSSPNRSVGILLSTNKACERFCNLFTQASMNFFRVSSFDLMKRPIVIDWLSYFKAEQGQANRIDWYNLFYRFSNSTVTYSKFTRAAIMSLVDSIYQQGITPRDIINYTDKPNTENNLTAELCRKFKQEGVVIFDTETTGLNFDTAKMIQIAGVHVIDGKIVREFNEYIKVDLTDEDLLKDLESSMEVHHINRDKLESDGRDLHEVLKDFFNFCEGKSIIAHNFDYDDNILKTSICSVDDNERLMSDYISILDIGAYDTLKLSRSLFPSLESHKLEFLLDHFKLEGVNSHNALDDVKATASLLKLIADELNGRLDGINNILTTHSAVIKDFQDTWIKLHSQMRYLRASASDSALEMQDHLEEWLMFVEHKDNSNLYPQDSRESTLIDIRDKLLPWLNRNREAFTGYTSELASDNHKQMQKLCSMNESDLIDPSTHRLIISTIHRSKGLEFETVIVPEVTDNSYPRWIPKGASEESIRENEAESKRLLYVALSRPINKLIVSYHQIRGRYPANISPYIKICEATFKYNNLKSI